MIDEEEKQRRDLQDAQRERIERVLDEAASSLSVEELGDVCAYAVELVTFRRARAS